MGLIQVKESAFGVPNSLIAFSHRCVFSGTSIAGDGAAAKVISVPGVLATDIVIVTFLVNASNRYILTVVPATDQITVTASNVTAVTDYYQYSVFRAVD